MLVTLANDIGTPQRAVPGQTTIVNWRDGADPVAGLDSVSIIYPVGQCISPEHGNARSDRFLIRQPGFNQHRASISIGPAFIRPPELLCLPEYCTLSMECRTGAG